MKELPEVTRLYNDLSKTILNIVISSKDLGHLAQSIHDMGYRKMEKMEIKIGDVVKVKGINGPKMTVDRVYEYFMGDIHDVYTMWFEDSTLHKGCFNFSVLEKIS